MNGKNMLFGLGLGLVCSGAALLFFNQNSSQQMTDAEIKKRAEELGMVEENQNAILTSEIRGNEDETDDSSKEEADESDREISADKTNTDSVPGDGQEIADSSEGRENNKLNQEDNKKAEGTASKEQGTENSGDVQNGISGAQADGESDAVESGQNANTTKKKKKKKKKETAEEQAVEDAGTTVIEIKSGMSAISICRILQENGLIENAEDFKNYLVGKNIQHELRAGLFEIPNNADYEKIVALIHKGNIN